MRVDGPEQGGSNARYWIIGIAIVIIVAVILTDGGREATSTPSTQPATASTERPLRWTVAFQSTCQRAGSDRGAHGTVTNNSSVSVDVFIEVDYENALHVIVDQGNDWIASLPPGRTASWSSRSFNGSWSTCSARVSSVYES